MANRLLLLGSHVLESETSTKLHMVLDADITTKLQALADPFEQHATLTRSFSYKVQAALTY